MKGITDQIKELLRPFYLRWVYFPLRPEARPPYWRDCWRYRRVEGAAAGRPPDILFLPMNDWHARMQRPQHLARALASFVHRCFYLSPHLGREFPQPVRLSRTPVVCQLEERIFEVHAGLNREPVFHQRMLEEAESREVARQVGGVLTAFGTQQLVLVSQLPLWNYCCKLLKEQFQATLVADCHDLLSGFSRVGMEIVGAEAELFRQADVVVFSAKSLLEKKLTEMPWLGEKAHLVRNGVDVRHFQTPRQGSATGRKVVGYAGALDEWFDGDAVRRAAEAHPDCDFVLLGRIEDPKVRALESLPNVRFYGEIPYDRIPVYLAEFDVALIPFLVNPLTLATNPIKLYEYFSCGLPVVSSALPEVTQFEPLVYVARTAADFAAQVGKALGEQAPEVRQQRRAIAASESWHARAQQMMDAIGRATGSGYSSGPAAGT